MRRFLYPVTEMKPSHYFLWHATSAGFFERIGRAVGMVVAVILTILGVTS